MTRFRLALPAALCLAFACGTVEDAPIIGGNGGLSATGGASGGGSSSTGGGSEGGSLSAGGQAASGGSPSTGGQEASGGSESGGSPSNGGSGDGGDSASGGTDGSGGAPPGSGGGGSGGSTPAGVCGGDTPHGCYVPRPNNPRGCPPQIHEQSSYFPPPDEWERCSSPPLAACVYENPEGGEAECRCNVGGEMWLCSY